jgi:uncharacterized membrane protein YhfC
MTIPFYLEYALAVTTVVAVPLGLASWFIRRHGGSWRGFLCGAAVFLAIQALFRLPFIRLMHEYAGSAMLLPARYIVLLALSAGVFEELGRYIGYKLLLRRNLDLSTGVVYGLGHGWMESVLTATIMAVAAVHLSALSGLGLSNVQFSPEQLIDIRNASSWWPPVVGGLERISMLPIHVLLSLLVLRGVRCRQVGWLAAAVCLHFAFNLGIGLTMGAFGLAAGETLAILAATGSILIIRRLFWRKSSPYMPAS